MDVVLEVPEHPHPLKLIDLHLQYEVEEEEEDQDDGDSITKEGFQGITCERCKEEIYMHHRYYYKCMAMGDSSSSHHFSFHKLCGELPERLEHPSHLLHTLCLKPFSYSYTDWKYLTFKKDYGYECDQCRFFIDVKYAMEVGKNVIHHPCHPHLLMCAICKPILCGCSACGKEHKGIFYQCTTCVNFNIHNECAFLLENLLI
uniref:DC1 domain-containing protein n=1 Tax=Lactuca sativa TaxID=4236 RepID=A0A9R1VM47_LACSA|nr:hypothetical protein LSAT_V11C500279480 [Lactuca sativa]